MYELQLILENIRNELTVIRGIVQLEKPCSVLHEKMLIGSVSQADNMVGEAMNILELYNHQRTL